MPDLSQAAVHQFWKDYPDPMIYRVIAFLEGVEDWTHDGDPELESQFNKLGEELDNLEKVDMSELGHEELFIRIGCHIKSGRVLRLLQAIDTAHPGSASRLLIHAEESSVSPEDPAGIFIRRNIVFERLRLLGRVFSKERLALVIRAIEGEEHE